MTDPQLPRSLRVLAWITILIGVSAALDIVIAPLFGAMHLNPAVLQLPAGIGLLRRSRGWRTFQLVCIWLGYVGFALGLVGIAVRGDPVVSEFPELFHPLGKPGVVLFLGLTLAFMIWEHHVLTRPEVKRVFGL